MDNIKVGIIGAGPAGIAAAIQLKRFGFVPIVFEAAQIGGLLHNANLVENYPGFPGGISGINLVKLIEEQFLDHEIDLVNEKVIDLDYSQGKDHFMISTGEHQYFSEIIVVATGTNSRVLTGFDSISSDLFYEVKDLTGIKNKHIIIIGAGDAAFDYAINLSRNNDVTILNQGSETKCLPLLWERCKNNEKIRYLENTKLVSADHIDGRLRFLIDVNGEQREIIGDKLLAAIGREPEISFLSKKIIQQKDELISKDRLYFIGDVTNEIFRQASIAVGNGVLTAMKIYQKSLECSE